MSDFNNDQQSASQEFFLQEEARRQELFQADQEQSQQYYREQEQRLQQSAREAAQSVVQAQSEQQLDQKQFQQAVGEWDRPDLQDLGQPKFEVGDKVQASFATQTSETAPQFEFQQAAIDGGHVAEQEVEVVATANISAQEYRQAFEGYGDQPQPFLQGHSGQTPEGVQKAVAVSAPGMNTVVVVPNQQGQAQSFGFAPRPALATQIQEQQGQVAEQKRAEAPAQRPVEAAQSVANEPKLDPVKPQSISSNRWGSEGISDRWSTHESEQRSLQSQINIMKREVHRTEDEVREILKSRESFIELTRGMTPDEIKKDNVLAAKQVEFESNGEQLERTLKTLKNQSADLVGQQNQYAANHAGFQADAWARVRQGGEVMGSPDLVSKASQMQDQYRAEIKNINTKQQNPLSAEAQKMVGQFEKQQQEQKSLEQPAPSATKTSDLSLSTRDYMLKQQNQARDEGAKVSKSPESNSNAVSELSRIATKAREARELAAKTKAEKEQKQQGQQAEESKKVMRP